MEFESRFAAHGKADQQLQPFSRVRRGRIWPMSLGITLCDGEFCCDCVVFSAQVYDVPCPISSFPCGATSFVMFKSNVLKARIIENLRRAFNNTGSRGYVDAGTAV